MAISTNVNTLMAGTLALVGLTLSRMGIVATEGMRKLLWLYQNLFAMMPLLNEIQLQLQDQKADQTITQGWIRFGSDISQAVATAGMAVAGEFMGNKPLKEADALELGPEENQVTLTQDNNPTLPVSPEAPSLTPTRANTTETEEVYVEGRVQSPSRSVAIDDEEVALEGRANMSSEIEENQQNAAIENDNVSREGEIETAEQRQARLDKIKRLQDKSMMIKQQFNGLYAPMVQSFCRSIFSAADGYASSNIVKQEGRVQFIIGISEMLKTVLSSNASFSQWFEQKFQENNQALIAAIQVSTPA